MRVSCRIGQSAALCVLSLKTISGVWDHPTPRAPIRRGRSRHWRLCRGRPRPARPSWASLLPIPCSSLSRQAAVVLRSASTAVPGGAGAVVQRERSRRSRCNPAQTA